MTTRTDPPPDGVGTTTSRPAQTEWPKSPGLDYLFGLDVEVGDVVSMGEGPLGERRIVAILGGTCRGPAVRGRVLAGGADWQIVRRDGVIELDARYVIEDDQQRRIQVTSQGYRHGPPEIIAALARGETVDPRHYVFRTVMRFETGSADLDWLNRTLAVATAERLARRVRLEAWRLL